MRHFLLSICLLAIIPANIDAQSLSAVQSIEAQIKGKVLILRHPFRNNDQVFDASGNLVGNGKPGYWNEDSLFTPEQVKAKGDEVVIKGQRIAVVWVPDEDRKKNGRVPSHAVLVKTGSTVSLKLPLSGELATEINKITVNLDEFLMQLPVYFRTHFDELMGGKWTPTPEPAPRKTAQPGIPATTVASEPQPSAATSRDVNSGLGQGASVGSRRPATLVVSQHPSAPTVLVEGRPDPTGYEGVVRVLLRVGTDGTPIDPVIVQSAGAENDRACLAGVSRWHFAPAMLDGRPVEVSAQIEVRFGRQ